MTGNRERSAPVLRASYDPLAQPQSPASRPAERFPWIYLLIFIVGAAVVAMAVSDYIERQRVKMRAHWETEISEVVSDRAQLIGNWLDARRADAEVLAASPPVRALLAKGGRADEGLIRHLSRMAAAYGYASAAIFDARGRVVARSRGGADPNAGRNDVARAVAHTGHVRIDLSEEGAERHQWLTIAVPALPDGELGTPSSAGSVALRMRADTSLFPLLTDETLTRKGESLLFRLDAADGGYLSPLRRKPGRPDHVEHSLDALRGLARAAGDVRAIFAEVTDYRDIPAFVAVRAIPHTGWGLAVKVDRDEAMAQYRRAARLGLAASGFLVLALAGFLISVWRHRQRASLVRAQLEQERAIFNLKGYAEKIVAGVPSGLVLLSADLRIVSVNPSFLESFEFREEEIEGHPLSDAIRADGLIRRAREVLQSGVALRDLLFELHLPHRQETRPVLIAMTPVRMAGEESARLLLLVKDLTEEERLQAARRTSEERFRDLVQGLDAIVWEADAETLRFSFVSQRSEEILGYPVEQWLTDDFFATRVHPDDRARTVAMCRAAIAEGEDHEIEYRALASDGREVWLRDIVHVVRDAGAGSPQLRGLTVDVTERKRSEEALRQTEEQLRQAQKMDAVGKLAGGIAHDFNNLLMVIRSDADLILRRLGAAHALRQNAEGIREAADQAATLTRQLLAFSRKQVLAPAELDLNAVVSSIQKMLQRLIGETIHLVTVTDPDLWRVRADPGQLEQMIVNLAVNARDAMPDGGRLTIRTANAELDAAMAGHSGVKPGSYATLEVSDTGVGMDAETRAHLFEPFFTTKGQGKGTGLGLSTVYGIVNQSGGHIQVESEKGRGATLRIYLPRVDPVPIAEPAFTVVPGEETVSASASLAGTAERVAPGGLPQRQTILLVEDARRVREVVREILAMNGYEVLEARHATEALELSERHAGPIHLMLTDVVMPQLSGHELARRLGPLRPEMRVLYMSGYTDDDIVRHGVLGAGIAFIAKPFTPDALATKVRAVLSAPEGGSRADRAARPFAPASPREGTSRPSIV